jgi:hypothetical protein
VLGKYSEEERRAREFGDFMHFGGMVYPGGFEHRLVPVPSPDQVQGHDVVVGIDPGLKNCALVWVAFDTDNQAVVFDEHVVKEGTPIDWAKAIRQRTPSGASPPTSSSTRRPATAPWSTRSRSRPSLAARASIASTARTTCSPASPR